MQLSNEASMIFEQLKKELAEEDIDIRQAAENIASEIADNLKKEWLLSLDKLLTTLEEEQEEKNEQNRLEYLGDLLHDMQKEEAMGL